MRTLKKIAILLLCTGLLFSTSSCVVLVKKDNGKHKGWFKNPNNSHNPISKNPGMSKGKSKR
jgi:hypothetical protein